MNTRHGKVYGVKAENASLEHAEVLKRKNKVVKILVSGVKAQLKASGVIVINDTAEILDKNSVRAGGDVIRGRRLLIATGSAPVTPPLPGVEECLASGFLLTNREILDMAAIPEKLVIIGGGVMGLEPALYFNSAGSRVTVIEALPKIAGQADGEISAALLDAYSKRGVEFHLNTRVTENQTDGFYMMAGR